MSGKTMAPVHPEKVYRAEAIRSLYFSALQRGEITISKGSAPAYYGPPECGCGAYLYGGEKRCPECISETAVERFREGQHAVNTCADEGAPEGYPDWEGMPLCRFRWGSDAGDPSVGIDSWAGWCLDTEQEGTVLGYIFRPEHDTAARAALAGLGHCNVDLVVSTLDAAGFIIVPKVVP